ALGVALAGPHPGLGRLLRVGLVGEDVDPDLAAPLDVAGDGDTCGLDLAARDPAGLDCLAAEVTEVDLGATLGQPPHAAAVLLAVLDLLGAKHRWTPPAPGAPGARPVPARREWPVPERGPVREWPVPERGPVREWPVPVRAPVREWPVPVRAPVREWPVPVP